jgi:hypothetical protein
MEFNLRGPRGTFRERLRTFDPRTKTWRIEGIFTVATVVFHVEERAIEQRGEQACIVEGELRVENGERDFLVSPKPEPMARSRSGR